ncbi:MAG: lanthionine synthetase C family protein [Saprospiraceae bacterium]|nr:lanthionine synthetase C family protein [Saprospiraceae bacterium]
MTNRSATTTMDQTKKIRQLLDRINYTLNQTVPGYNGLLGGNSGFALYQFYLYRVLGEQQFSEKAESVLDNIFETVNSEDPRLTGTSYAVGAAGFGYLMNHLVGEEHLDFDLEESLAELDEHLFQTAVSEIETGQLDFLHQAAGILHYFASKPSIEPHRARLETLLNAIDAQALRDELGWRHVSSFGPRSGIHYDLSTAHGLSGLLLILMNLYENGLPSEQIRNIVREGTRFLLYFQRNTNAAELRLSAFPLSVEIEHLQPDYSNMLAWCYGDFGPALVLARAGRLFQNDEWLEAAADMAQTLSRRLSVEHNLVQNDAHFCHGAAGVAQCFRALHRYLPSDELWQAYQNWIDITLNLMDDDLENGTYVGKEIGLLEGMVGVALTLLSALSEDDLRWDKALLL